MTPDKRRVLLKRAGRTLYGDRWQTELARDLQCSDRTIRRWASGDKDVPEIVIAELRGLLMTRGAAIDGLIADMEATA